MKMLKLGVLLAAVIMSGCSTVTIHPQSMGKLSSPPTYEERKGYFLWGLAGEHRIDVQQVCGEKEPKQMQSQATFVDGLLGVITLGIYAPHTAKVWCE